ncbi:hemin uptake protein HemP [Sulfuriferula nivalis]|uniref:Hemin uptake protein HemP n=1 Tax=Sulfuriferula nivalis TaxID=2675298 RepID=A0A809S3F3_9PROT|nr:hemin uptake protein HemP [Sulfuriferula nivalis]BBP01298.1 hypothetical protein SFSGTM_20060 [Sulfuriferula nivalis]
MNTKKETGVTPATTSKTAQTPPRYDSKHLFGEGNVAIIQHAGREYQLRITAGNKLILTA